MPWTNYVSDLSVGLQRQQYCLCNNDAGNGIFTGTIFILLYKRTSRIQHSGTRNLCINNRLNKRSRHYCNGLFPSGHRQASNIQHPHNLLFLGMTGFLGAYGWVFFKLSEFPNILGLLAYAASLFSFIFAILLALTELFGVLNQHAVTYLIE